MDRKILVISETVYFNLYKEGLMQYAKDNKDSIDLYYLDDLRKDLNTVNKFRYKFDICAFKKKYYTQLRKELIEKVKPYEVVLFINFFHDDEYFVQNKFIQGKFAEILKKKDTRVLFVDSIKTINQSIDCWDCFKEIWSFEEQDVSYAKKKFGIEIKYVTIGTSYNMFLPEKAMPKDIDVCFVGLASEKRLKYLDAVAAYCDKKGLRFWVSGHFWHTNNWLNYHIGEWKFKRKHPILAKYVQNKFIMPKDLALIYARSKIILNINMAWHKSLNQRCFDVMICDSLLMNDRQNVGKLPLHEGEDLVMADDEKDMINKIDFYLQNEGKRQKIAHNGKKKAEKTFVFKRTLMEVLGE